MRSLPQPSQQIMSTWTKSEDREDAPRVSRAYYISGRPSSSADRMFELFESNAEVEILFSEADDRLAASVYCGAKVLKKKKTKKQKNGTSGYNFDSLLKDYSRIGIPFKK